MDDIIVAEGLYKTYYRDGQAVPVLKGVNLKVKKGEIISIVGPSGVGKSTLLHLLGALDRPTKGKVFLEREEVYNLNDGELATLRNRRIGFLFQFHHLLSEFTALENVMMPGLISSSAPKGRDLAFGGEFGVRLSSRGDPRSPRESSEIGERAREILPRRAGRRRVGVSASLREIGERARKILEEMGLGKRLDHRPCEISGGEQQRVALARALVNEPDVIIADEPTGNLDRKTAEAIHSLLWKLNKEKGKTLILATHNEELARRAKRLVRLVDGRITD
ncbi:ABC transporter ATP-binding protein [bacterium]|nr:ABC transporter ATP-binding protein [bacterium]